MVSKKFEDMVNSANNFVAISKQRPSEDGFLTVRCDDYLEDNHIVKVFSQRGVDVYEPSIKRSDKTGKYSSIVLLDMYDDYQRLPARVDDNDSSLPVKVKKERNLNVIHNNIGAFLSLSMTAIITAIAVVVLGLPIAILVSVLTAFSMATVVHQFVWGGKEDVRKRLQSSNSQEFNGKILIESKADEKVFKNDLLVAVSRKAWGLMKNLFKNTDGDFMVGLVKQKVELNDGDDDLMEWLTAVYITLESTPDFPIDSVPLITEDAVSVANKAVERGKQDARRNGELERTYTGTLKNMATDDSRKAMERANEFLERF